MKKLLALLLLIPSFSQAIELKPLSKIIEERDLKDRTTNMYLIHRCSGLMFLNNSLIIEEQHKDTVKEMENKIDFLLNMSKFFDRRYGLSSDEELTDEAIFESKKFYDLYFKLYEKNWYENGAYFAGTWIENDVVICNKFYDELLSDLKKVANQ